MSINFCIRMCTWKKVVSFQSNQNNFTYHCVLVDGWNSWYKFEEYDLKGTIGEIMMNETMIKK